MLRISESLVDLIKTMPLTKASNEHKVEQQELLEYLQSVTDITVGFGRAEVITYLIKLMNKDLANDALTFFVGKIKSGTLPKEGILDLSNTLDLLAMHLSKGETINENDTRYQVVKDMTNEFNLTKKVIEASAGTQNSPITNDLLNKIDILDKAGVGQVNLTDRGNYIQLVFPHLSREQAQSLNASPVHEIELFVELNPAEDDLGSRYYARSQVEHLKEEYGINAVVQLLTMSEDDTLEVTNSQKDVIMEAAEHLLDRNLGSFGIDEDSVSALEDLEVGRKSYISRDAFDDLNEKVDKYILFIKFLEQFNPLNHEDVLSYLTNRKTY